MRVLVTHAPFEMSFEERPVPTPDPDEVLVKTRAIGLCGSDVHLYDGTHPYRTYPNVFGHEVSGWVAGVGGDVVGLSEGDHVTLEPLIWCGECYPCSIGRTNCCSRMRTIGVTEPGAMGDFFVVPARCLHKVAEDLPARVAALCEPYSVGFHATGRGNVNEADQVVVIGVGPIGLTVLAAAKRRGAQVAVTDLIDKRLEIARDMGADVSVNSGRTDPVPVIREWTKGNMASVVVEAVGHPKTIESTIDLVADGGRVVIVGVTEDFASIRGVDMTKKELSIYGSRNNLGRFPDAIEFVETHTDVAGMMITDQYPFEQAIEAFEVAEAHPEQVCKVVLDFEGEEAVSTNEFAA